MFAHWKKEEEYKSSPPLAKSTQRFLNKALMRKTTLLHANAFIKDGVLGGAGPKPGEEVEHSSNCE